MLTYAGRYNLHGILCDDMGLGKTLQTIALIASDVVNRRERFACVLILLSMCPHTAIGVLILYMCPHTLGDHRAHSV